MARPPGEFLEFLPSLAACSALCYSLTVRKQLSCCFGGPSGRGSAWLERLVRDQEVEGSNPFAPTTLSPALTAIYTATACCSSTLKTCPDLSIIGSCLLVGSTKPRPTLA